MITSLNVADYLLDAFDMFLDEEDIDLQEVARERVIEARDAGEDVYDAFDAAIDDVVDRFISVVSDYLEEDIRMAVHQSVGIAEMLGREDYTMKEDVNDGGEER